MKEKMSIRLKNGEEVALDHYKIILDVDPSVTYSEAKSMLDSIVDICYGNGISFKAKLCGSSGKPIKKISCSIEDTFIDQEFNELCKITKRRNPK